MALEKRIAGPQQQKKTNAEAAKQDRLECYYGSRTTSILAWWVLDCVEKVTMVRWMEVERHWRGPCHLGSCDGLVQAKAQAQAEVGAMEEILQYECHCRVVRYRYIDGSPGFSPQHDRLIVHPAITHSLSLPM